MSRRHNTGVTLPLLLDSSSSVVQPANGVLGTPDSPECTIRLAANSPRAGCGAPTLALTAEAVAT